MSRLTLFDFTLVTEGFSMTKAPHLLWLSLLLLPMATPLAHGAPASPTPRVAAPARPGPASAGAARPAAPTTAARPAAPAAAARRARAKRKPRVAVLIVATGGIAVDLADNLTEVLIVNVATRGHFQVVGKEVVKAQLGGTDKQVLRCINNKTCVGNVSTELALDYLIVGTLGKFEDLWLYNLYFIDASSATEKKRVHKRVRGDLSALTKSLDQALAELLRPKPKPARLRVEADVAGATIHVNDQFAGSTPLVRVSDKPGAIRVRVEADGYYGADKTVRLVRGQTVVVKVHLVRIPPRVKTWKFHLAWATLGVALGTGLVAAVTGGLATKKTGATQADRLRDLDRRKNLALVSNLFSGLAGASAITSAALFLFARKGFYRGGKEEQPRAKAWFEIAPVRGGAAVTGGLRW